VWIYEIIDAIVPPWVTENFWLFVIIMVVILLGLIGLLIYLRSQREEE
jgi:hypothetical protein